MLEVHPTACVSPLATLTPPVKIGAWSMVEDHAFLGPGCHLGHHVTIHAGARLGAANTVHEGAVVHGHTELGDGNTIHEGAVIGGAPLMRHSVPPGGRLCIGARNVIRELTTIQRATTSDCHTVLGNDNYIMPSVQIGHDCCVGNRVTMANYTALAGHVSVGNDAVFGLGAVVHQYCRIGELAMIGAAAYVAQDIAPFMLVDGRSGGIAGLNLVGLKRNGFAPAEIAELKRAFRLIFRERPPWAEVLARLGSEFTGAAIERLRVFLAATQRGLARSRRERPEEHREGASDIFPLRRAA